MLQLLSYTSVDLTFVSDNKTAMARLVISIKMMFSFFACC